MRINKLLFGFLLLVVFVVHPTVSDNPVMETITGSVPLLIGLTEKLIEGSPAAPFVVAGLSFLHLLTTVLFGGSDDDPDKLTKLDLDKAQKAIIAKLNNIDAHITESTETIIRELELVIKSDPLFRRMRNQLDDFDLVYRNNMPLILSPDWSEHKINSVKLMTNCNSDFRKQLGTFITTYIQATRNIAASDPTEMFFEFVKAKDESLARKNLNCNKDSLHYKIFKSYIYITKSLLDSYTMVLTAHAVQYQKQIRENNIIDANGTKMSAGNLLVELKDSIEKLMSKTKWIMEKSSREIKNCGAFSLEEGQTFERLRFVTTVAKWFDSINLDTYRKFVPPYIANLNCTIEDDKYCTNSRQLVEPRPRRAFTSAWMFEFYYNPNDVDRPLSHAKYYQSTFGHENSSPGLIQQETNYNVNFCGCYRKVGISMQRVHADPGNVITGVRWRVRKNVLYIDIQQAKWINDLEVDPHTVWRETPEDSDQVVYLSTSLRKIEIADHILDDGYYLTAIQLQQTYMTEKGVIKLFVEGSKSPCWASEPKGTYASIDETNQINLADRDDPQKASANVNRLISMPPDPKKPAYVKFQVSSIKKDLGRTTIPFIDRREVFTDPPSPVVGIGIYHEAVDGEGGLLALKLVSPSLAKYIDYTQFINFVTPEREIV